MSKSCNKVYFDETIFQNEELCGLPKEIKYDLKTVNRVSEISYQCFFTDYLMTNKPCVITHLETETWKSRHDWVTTEGLPDFSFLSKQFGSFPYLVVLFSWLISLSSTLHVNKFFLISISNFQVLLWCPWLNVILENIIPSIKLKCPSMII